MILREVRTTPSPGAYRPDWREQDLGTDGPLRQFIRLKLFSPARDAPLPLTDLCVNPIENAWRGAGQQLFRPLAYPLI